LPGLDGGGLLLEDFVRALGAHFDVQTIRYPPAEALGYDQLQDFITPRLPAKPFILIGESFSGPLALRISASRPPPPCLLGVVLGASFARLGPAPLRRALRSALWVAAPFIHIGIAAFPLAKAALPWALSPLLLGRWATPEGRRRLGEALAQVSPHVLTFRAREALSADLAGGGTRPAHPALYMRAAADRLIHRSAARGVAALSDSVRIIEIEAPHFLFQAAPFACASAIRDFASGLTRGE
jgi:pimeloyl-[acyl-carrier protein] methyl ester esterase